MTCPKCDSENIEFIKNTLTGFITATCSNSEEECGNQWTLAPVEAMLADIRDKLSFIGSQLSSVDSRLEVLGRNQ